MKEKMTLTELLATSEAKKILFLGRGGIFSDKERERFLKKFSAVCTSDYEEDTAAVIEGTMLNAFEEDISNMAYEKGVALYKLQDFEKILSETMNDDELLMSIKLANDQERLFRLLGNTHFNDTLFVKLLSMYEWDDEEEDSRDDRDVIMYTLQRYIDIKPNEQDLLYSYLTLRRLATEATDPNLLLALIRFHNFVFLLRGKEKITLRETIAKNENVNDEVIRKLISLRDLKVDMALASNRSVPVSVLEKFLHKEEEAVSKALATNTKIDDTIFGSLMKKGDSVVELLLVWQPINAERLALIEEMSFEDDLFALLGVNEHLDTAVVKKLLEKKHLALLMYLAQNSSIKAEALEEIYLMDMTETFALLAKNPSTPVKVLETLYQDHKDEKEILSSLAYNGALPLEILKALFEEDDLEINKGLATNASLPMEMLNILKIDTRLQNYLAENPVFIKAYETVLDYDKNAVQF
jgi:hypothetical protein